MLQSYKGELSNDENPEIIILGKQAIDDDSNQTGQMLAALLGMVTRNICF